MSHKYPYIINGTVVRYGGGRFVVLVDPDTVNYPEVGTRTVTVVDVTAERIREALGTEHQCFTDHQCFTPSFLLPGDFHKCSCGRWYKRRQGRIVERRPAWWAKMWLHLHLATELVRLRRDAER